MSTRHESAEMMGVTIPDLPHCPSDDNVNLGEKDSIRRRALWALEGKPDAPCPKVEIPELSNSDMERLIFDFQTKPSYSAGSSSSYGSGLNSLLVGNKRDSFKLLAASGSSKDQLHTLIEEEEEEEEEEEKGKSQGGPEHSFPSPTSSIEMSLPTTPINPPPIVAVTKSIPSRPRPATLNLRPLSLTPDNLITTVQGLPTPSPTPSPTTGLGSLPLSPSPHNDAATTIVPPAQSTSSRRPILNLKMDHCESPSPMSGQVDNKKPARRSSISYKRSSHGVAINMSGLPTPEMTPTFSRRYSVAESVRSSSSGDDEFFPNPPAQAKPLSVSEQHFLFKSHNALLARITDLERALSTRRLSSGFSINESSRPNSVSSNFSSSSDLGSMSGGASDEMFSFVRDLKSERDELKKDVDGWRTRVSDLEKQLGIMTNRVDAERREAWVARSRVGLLEVEKASLVKRFEAVDDALKSLEEDKRVLQEENKVLHLTNSETKQRVKHLEAEVETLKKQLQVHRFDPLATPTTPRNFDAAHPRMRGLGFTSMDSESSATDVEGDSFDDHQRNFGFMLKAVEEESEADGDEYSEEENGLAGYEDEEESDVDFPTSSSFGSEDNQPRSLARLQMGNAPTNSQPTPLASTNVFVPAGPTHASRASLSKTWTFPKGPVVQGRSQDKEDNSVDRFFGCLEELDADSDGPALTSPSVLTYETSKGIFASGFTYGSADDNAPFFLPGGVGVVAEGPAETAEKRLSAVAEAEEDDNKLDADGGDDDMFGEVGGIRITFTPPEEIEEKLEPKQLQISPVKPASKPPVLPVLNFCGEDEDEEDLGAIPFNFGRSVTSERLPSPPPSQPITISSHSSIPCPTSPRAASPSSIPRSTAFRRSIHSPKISASTPPKPTSGCFVNSLDFSPSAYVTPPTKRGGAMPSFIPQPVSSPSPMRSAPAMSKPKAVPTSTFIPQPLRKPIVAASNGKSQNGTNEHMPMNTRSSHRSPADTTIAAPCSQSFSEIKSVAVYDYPDSVPQPYPSVDSEKSIRSAPSSFSSIMSSPLAARLPFQAFSNFMSWAPRYTDAAISSAPSRSDRQPEAPRPISHKQVFVSREQQLRKLKLRMETEGSLVMRDSVQIHCKRCDDGLVLL